MYAKETIKISDIYLNEHFISLQELYFINERSIYFERNIINFRNNRKLADPDNQFDLNNFYESALDFVSAFNDYNDDDEEMTCLLNMIDSHVNKNKENNTIFNLNNVSEETKKIIYELQKELEEAKKELDSIRNAKLEIQPIQDKKITEQDEYNYISEHEGINQLENEDIKQLENEDIKQLENEVNNWKMKTLNNWKMKALNNWKMKEISWRLKMITLKMNIMKLYQCEIFNDIDALFIDYETNEEQFNDDNGLYNKYCPIKSGSKRCKTNYEKLSAISRHAYTELMQNENVDLDSENDLHGDFLIMGLSNKLYNISKDHSLSLKDSFGKYLGNSIGSFNHHSILYNKKYFSDSNIGIMNGFYFLFKQICETINISEKPNAQQHEYINSVTQCLIMYDKLYDFVNQCDPYLQLLYHLKTIYNDLIDAVIKANGNDESLRSKLIKLSSIDKTTFGSEFNTKGCKKVNKKFEQNISKIANKSQEEQDEQDELSTLIELLGSDDDDDDGENGDDAASTDGTDDADTQTDISSGLVNSQDKYDTQGNEQKDSDDGQVSQPASSNGETGSGTDTGAGGTGSGTVGGSDNGAGTGLGSVQGGASGGSGINHQGTNGGTDSQGSIDSGSSSQGGTGNGTGDGTKVSGDQATKHSSGASDGYLSNLWRTRL
ncbi:hypothetical protein YYG_04967, partial [Plasmodium vinckei petteri]